MQFSLYFSLSVDAMNKLMKRHRLLRTFQILIFSSIIFIISECQQKIQWKGHPEYFQELDQVNDEISTKIARLCNFMEDKGLSGVYFSRPGNIFWITAGLCRVQSLLNIETGLAGLLILEDGRRFLISRERIAQRLMDENLTYLGYECKTFPWHEEKGSERLIREITDGKRVGSDILKSSMTHVTQDISVLQQSLTVQEVERYKWLGREISQAVSDVCIRVQPGMDEFEIEYLTAKALRSRGITPTRLMTVVDDRVFTYGNALPFGATLKKYAMISVAGEKWGLSAAVTRHVHFGPVPKFLQERHRTAAKLMAGLQSSTVPGKSLSDVYDRAIVQYKAHLPADTTATCFPGGPIGYNYREYDDYAASGDSVNNNQSFTWNVFFRGVKFEDTFLAREHGIELLTITEDWPVISVDLGSQNYIQPDILVR